MKKEEILSSLCEYDKRNPDCTFDDEEIQERKERLLKKKTSCFCDNCFYGRTELAEYILKILNESATPC